jgi:hypothetical protein
MSMLDTHPHFDKKRHKWFCSEVLTVALQAMDVEAFWKVQARHSSPNMVYRVAARTSSQVPTTSFRFIE